MGFADVLGVNYNGLGSGCAAVQGAFLEAGVKVLELGMVALVPVAVLVVEFAVSVAISGPVVMDNQVR